MNPESASIANNLPTAYALRISELLDTEGFPEKLSWEQAPALRFDHEWNGQNADPGRATEVRLLWSPETLYLRFHCVYRTVTVFPDARTDGWRDHLWDRDVAETFLQPDSSDPLKYKEFEVSPNGYWIDLDILHGQRQELHSGLRRRVVLDAKRNTWTAELALPLASLTTRLDPQKIWRVNFYRVEGEREPRFYSAWSPTHTPKPNFHVPARFGKLVFRDKK
jgi:alpha-galactosidase